jgi:hypothetical protein
MAKRSFYLLDCFSPHGTQIAVSNIATTATEMTNTPTFSHMLKLLT